MAPVPDASVAQLLLAHLRAEAQAPRLDYAEAPQRVAGGFETTIFRFALAAPPAWLAGPLIVRILRAHYDPSQAQAEAAIQTALSALGYPAPRAMLVCTDPTVLGGAFMVMQRLPGRPLAEGMEAIVTGAGVGRVLRLLGGVSRVLERMTVVWAEAQLRLHALPPAPVIQRLEEAGLAPEAYTYEGRLAALGQVVDSLGNDSLACAHAWLQANRPSAAAAPAVCHGDLHPLNILAQDGAMTGVIDWGNTTIADPAFDVGSTIAALRTTPLDLPASALPLVRGLLRYLLWRYRRAYGRQRVVDEGAVRYYQVFRHVSHLAGALRSQHVGGAPAGTHQLPAARRLLIARIRALSGITVSVAP